MIARLTTENGEPLANSEDITLLVSLQFASQPADLNRLLGTTINNLGQTLATFTIPQGTPSGSDILFTGISINNDEIMNGEEQFRLVITGLPFSQISGDGIVGFVDVTIDDDDGKLYSYTCQNIIMIIIERLIIVLNECLNQPSSSHSI